MRQHLTGETLMLGDSQPVGLLLANSTVWQQYVSISLLLERTDFLRVDDRFMSCRLKRVGMTPGERRS